MKNTVCGKINAQLGQGNVIHPLVTFKGPIIIGNYNIFEEKVEIINESADPLHIGDYNLFQVGTSKISLISEYKGPKIGNNNVFAVNSSTFAEIGNDTVVQRQLYSRKVDLEFHKKHIEYLQQILPKYHSIN